MTLQYDRRLHQNGGGNKLQMAHATEQAIIHGVGVHHLSTRFNNVQGESRTYTVAPNNDDSYHFPTGYQQQLEAISIYTCLHPNNTLKQQVPHKHHVSVGSKRKKWPRHIHRPPDKNHPNLMSHKYHLLLRDINWSHLCQNQRQRQQVLHQWPPKE